jgi:hypothetical protein
MPFPRPITPALPSPLNRTLARSVATSLNGHITNAPSLRVRRVGLAVLSLVLATNLMPCPIRADDTTANSCGRTRFENARIEAIDSNNANLAIRDCVQESSTGGTVCNCPLINATVDNLAVRAQVKSFHPGDHVRLDILQANDQVKVIAIRGPWAIDPSFTTRLLVLATCALALLAFATAVTRGAPRKFIVGMDNRYSNSKFQVALWFWLVLSSYLAVIICRVFYAGWSFLGCVNIPAHLMALSGLSALTYGGAKAITTAKVDASINPTPAIAGAATPAANLDPKGALAPGQERFFRNLVQNDAGGFDFGDFQMVIVTLLAFTIYLLSIFHFLGSIDFTTTATLPDVDTTLLALFGLGQGAYLTKKAAGNVGTS